MIFCFYILGPPTWICQNRHVQARFQLDLLWWILVFNPTHSNQTMLSYVLFPALTKASRFAVARMTIADNGQGSDYLMVYVGRIWFGLALEHK